MASSDCTPTFAHHRRFSEISGGVLPGRSRHRRIPQRAETVCDTQNSQIQKVLDEKVLDAEFVLEKVAQDLTVRWAGDLRVTVRTASHQQNIL